MSLGGGGQLEQLSQELQAIEAQQEALKGEIEDYRAEQREIDKAIEALETLDSGSTVQVPLGGDAYVHAEVGDIDAVTVSLGGGYAAERDREGAIGTLDRKRDAIDDRIDETRTEIDELDAESEQLEQQAQQMQQQQMQQVQQQMQQRQQGPGDADDE